MGPCILEHAYYLPMIYCVLIMNSCFLHGYLRISCASISTYMRISVDAFTLPLCAVILCVLCTMQCSMHIVTAQDARILHQAMENSNTAKQTQSDVGKPINIHFVWIQPNLGPRKWDAKEIRALQTVLAWQQAMNPVVVYFWTRDEIVLHFPELVQLLERISTPAWISDIVRYHVVHRFGGLYLDTDVHLIRDPTPLLVQFNGAFTVCQTPWWSQPSELLDPNYKCDSVINAIIASLEPGDETLQCAMTKSVQRTELSLNQSKMAYSLQNTGPPMWTECVLDFNFTTLPSWTFLPCPCCDGCNVKDYKTKAYAYGMHEWQKSWW